MGLLSNDYYKNLIRESQATQTIDRPPATREETTEGGDIFQTINETVENVTAKFSPYKQYVQSAPRPLTPPGVDPKLISPSTPVRTQGDISEARQAARFGGPVGSKEYYEYKAEHPYISFLPQQTLSSLGFQFPDMETWDKMSRLDQISHTGFMGVSALTRLAFELPREILKTPVRFGLSTVGTWVDIAKGKTTQEILHKEPVKLPWLGVVPTYWQSYQEALDAGNGPLAAALVSGSLALGDVVIVGALGEAVARGMQPRTAIKEGEPVKNTGPIKNALVEEKGVNKRESSSEYYRIPKTTAKDFGGSTNNTFLKLTPAGADSVELAVVQSRTGLFPRGVDYIKSKFGGVDKTYTGDFGPEIKLQSQIVKIKTPEAAAAATPLFQPKIGAGILENLRSELKILEDTIKQHPAYSLTKFAKEGKRELPEVTGLTESEKLAGKRVGEYGRRGDDIITELGFEDTAQAAAAYEELVKLRDQRAAVRKSIDTERKKIGEEFDVAAEEASLAKSVELEAQIEESLSRIRGGIVKPIPPAALRGFEHKMITTEQTNNLNLISRVNGIEPAVQDAVMRTVTGKNALGELTQGEYVTVAQTLATFNNLAKYAPDLGTINVFAQYGSPQRSWMRRYEERTGLPLYTEAYVPMENAIRIRDVFRDSYKNQAREIYGKYAKQSFYEERRLIKNYMEGDIGAIINNEKLSSAVKQELVDIANKIRPLYDELGQRFGIPTEVFLKDYQPHIQEIGGIFQLYKEGQTVPKSLSFFAQFKRRGSLANQVDDSLALFDIYVSAGSNKIFMNPVLERMGTLGEKLPTTVQNSLKSYVQEKLGYAGRIEQFLNEVGQGINRRLGTNLPPDVARQATQLIMDTTYSGGMGLNPGTVMRNGLQYDLLAYPRLGPKFYGDALKTSLTKEGMAEVREAGFLVELGVPYGQELAQDITLFGRAGNLYRKGTQATLGPFSMVEALNRARTYWQVKYQFNDALAKYNSGKFTWAQFEKELDFNALSPLDRNIIRQDLIRGDVKSAFENLAREVIDETQFPYRRGASSRITYGLGGRLGTQFGQWNIEFVHTLGRWIRTKQFDKVARFAASSYAIQRSLSDALGFDFTRSVGTGPFNVGFSPFIKTSVDFVEWLGAIQQGNSDAINENKDQIMNTFKSLGIPAGVEIQKFNKLRYSYEKGPIGPGGTYGVYDTRGRLQYWTTFDDLFWQAFGFPTNQKEQFRRESQQLRNAKVEYSEVKQKVLELYQQEKYDEANELVNRYGITLSPQDFDAYYIPYSDRTFQALPPTLKGRFAPQLYPVK